MHFNQKLSIRQRQLEDVYPSIMRNQAALASARDPGYFLDGRWPVIGAYSPRSARTTIENTLNETESRFPESAQEVRTVPDDFIQCQRAL